MNTLIKNGTLITASETFEADILIEDEKISLIGKNLQHPSAEVIDATGKLILPGGVDPHVHLDLPMFGTVSSDDHYTGHKAAAFGGTTTVMDFVVLEKEGFQTLCGYLDENGGEGRHRLFLPHEPDPLRREDHEGHPILREMGITTLKVFTAYNGRLRIDDGSIFKTMQIARDNGMLVMAHCENGDVIDTLVEQALAAGHTTPEWHALTRPGWGAVESTLRMAGMASAADASVYIVHMNMGGEVDMLKYARERGVKVMGETCPQYLFFTIDDLRRADGAKWICSPPMRSAEDNARLWEGLSAGHSANHRHGPLSRSSLTGRSPSSMKDARSPSPARNWERMISPRSPMACPASKTACRYCGPPGCVSGKITANQFVAYNCTNPAKIFGLYPRKGALLPGSDADIVIWDPEKKVTYGVATGPSAHGL